jgi:2-aminoethylphosphonate dioxygenase
VTPRGERRPPLPGAEEPQSAATYERDGYLVLRGLLDVPEAARLGDECDRIFSLPGLVQEGNLRTRSRRSTSGGMVIDRLDPVIDLSAAFRRLADDPRVRAAAAVALGEEPVLFKDKLIIKPPGTHGYSLHQDYMRWQFLSVPAASLVSVAVAFDAASPGSGAVEVFGGQHGSLLTAPGEVADPTEADVAGGHPSLVALEPGDALLLHSLAPHRSGPNRSERPRRMVFLTYSGRSFGDLYERYLAHHHETLLAALDPERRKMAFFA